MGVNRAFNGRRESVQPTKYQTLFKLDIGCTQDPGFNYMGTLQSDMCYFQKMYIVLEDKPKYQIGREAEVT